jgi:GTP-binding protein HflX
LTIDEDDLMTENAKTLHARRVESDLDELSGRRNALFISATHKENFEEFRERVYEAVRQIHITRFLQQILVSDYKDAVEKEEKRRRRKRIMFFYT